MEPLLEVKESTIHGLGVFAKQDIPKGTLIGEYTGELIDEDEADRRYPEAHPTYLFDLGEGMLIDGKTSDSPLKYINHATPGNCESEQDENKIFIHAIADIQAGEELTYDYNLIVEDDEDLL